MSITISTVPSTDGPAISSNLPSVRLNVDVTFAAGKTTLAKDLGDKLKSFTKERLIDHKVQVVEDPNTPVFSILVEVGVLLENDTAITLLRVDTTLRETVSIKRLGAEFSTEVETWGHKPQIIGFTNPQNSGLTGEQIFSRVTLAAKDQISDQLGAFFEESKS